jgi:DNA-directed RNA polymerase sigma subunit (sigma70/sigma32)
MTATPWRSDEGWPYRDIGGDVADPVREPDWDLLSLRASRPTLFETLSPLEQRIVISHYGLEDNSPMTMKEIRHETGLPADEVRAALGSGLAKLRAALADDR